MSSHVPVGEDSDPAQRVGRSVRLVYNRFRELVGVLDLCVTGSENA